ncbi:MAG: Gfo/Idh/MocA family oxidoreductase [Oscillospiraceae bacterium]|nr:Gfo/Idh/MocA family oxidoreductase [Oscillospiraceae bacterium]
MQIAKIGIIGTGHISEIYCQNLTTVHENTEIIACADINREAAEKKAAKWNIPYVLTVEELLAREDIDIVVNLTPPKNHYEIIKAALLAGKHVFTEKPLATTAAEADELVALAEERGRMLGAAPETNYGAGVSTAKALLKEGAIGKVLYADAHFRWPGDENWHPNPAFLYQPGAGPLYDRGPYFLNVLVDLLGSAQEVAAMTSIGFPTRTVTSKLRYGEVFPVETPSHVQGMLRFVSGVLCTIMLSFDIKGPYDSAIEIFGTEGSILIKEPIGFGNPVYLSKNTEPYEEVPFVNDLTGNIRGYSVADMAECIETGRTDHMAPGTRARHLLHIMEKMLESAETGSFCKIDTPL